MKKLVLLLLLSGCSFTAPPQDEARLWVERLSPACENQGLEEWTQAWTACIRTSYATQNRTPIANSADGPPVYRLTYCAPAQGDKYNCVTF
jgi:hypothetical protein